MSPVITQLPTMVSTKGMEGMSNQELKEALASMQRQVVQMGASMHSLTLISHNQADVMAYLVDAHERGDKRAIETKLQELSDWRKARSMPATQH